ncbi:MAG: universal stress protein family protein [Deltaproteobacteria bacterium]|jgi:nucleotide-binding universal stress UspA family protein|nr:universal stress protein family protein [Deltaproteobacteria bacterium]
MIKTILVGLDGSEHARTAMRYALWLGDRLSATVIGLHVVDIVSIEGSFFHDISGSLGFEPYLDFSSKMREVLHERGRGLLEEFREHATKAGVRFDTALSMGVVANEVAERARTADLVVIGHRGVNERFSTGLLGSTAESVTRKCLRPVLISTATFRPISRALLAYDGSERAASAMHAAAEFCIALSLPLTVLTVAKDSDSGEKVLGDARKYLASYQLDTQCVVQTGHAPERIVGYIQEHGFDLLFIGAYGHSRIIEMVLGSTTEYVLRNSGCPVFVNR